MTIRTEIEALRSMTVGRLRERYAEVFGEPSRSYNKQFLFRRVAWRIQALAEGGLSERARQRALEIANDADLRVRPPKDAIAYGGPPAENRATVIRVRHAADGRLPMPGSLLVRDYRGKQILVKVLENGFQYDDRQYSSLTAIAQEVTGTKWTGFAFFGLTPRRRRVRNGKPMECEVQLRRPSIRCAIYTRKSSEEGLQKEFNSLDAQRESAEAFIASQRGQGWQVQPELYEPHGAVFRSH